MRKTLTLKPEFIARMDQAIRDVEAGKLISLDGLTDDEQIAWLTSRQDHSDDLSKPFGHDAISESKVYYQTDTLPD